MKIIIEVHNEEKEFWFAVKFPTDSFRLPWEGGEFVYLETKYILQTPYHGHKTQQLYAMIPLAVEVEE